MIVHSTPFKNTHGNSLKKNAEYDYRLNTIEPKGSHSLRPFVDRPSGFYNRKTREPFTNMNTIGYTIDPYERKDDMIREEYARLNNKILVKNLPFSQDVRQRGTFLPNPLTFGTTIQFEEKAKEPRFVPKYGVFKKGDEAHTGINKTIGGGLRSSEYHYQEEMETDNVRYQKNVRLPIWRQTAQMSKSMANSSIMSNVRNTGI